MKLGLFGGTFDPIHLGHLRSAEEIGEALDLTTVYLIPSALPPHKTGEPVTPFHHRLAMTRLAAAHSARFEAHDLEGRRPGLSYSIETLKEFHRVYGPNPQLFFIVGTDAFLEIKTWKEYQSLFDYAHFVIMQRPGFQLERLEPLLLSLDVAFEKTDDPRVFETHTGNRLMLMKTTLMDISATVVRKLVREDKSVRFLVPEDVRNYVKEKGLYRSYGHPGKGQIMSQAH